MLNFNIYLEGAERLSKALDKLPQVARTGIEDSLTTIRNLVIGRTPVGIRKKDEHLKQSWSKVQETSEGFAFSTDKDYATILEEGLYNKVGPRTIQTEGGIFSRQAPGGIIGPIVEDEKLIEGAVSQIVDVLADYIERHAQ